jgi:hypothetical protein
MSSPFADSHDLDFIHPAYRSTQPSPLGQRRSDSEVASIENYGFNRTRDTSEEDSWRGLNSYRASGRRNHEYKTYLLDGKSVALPFIALSPASSSDIDSRRIEKPWTSDKKYKAPRKGNWYILGGLFLAIALSGVVNWRIAVGVPDHEVRLPVLRLTVFL